MTDHTSNNIYAGSVKVSCREAAFLLNEDLVDKAYFRPNGIIDYNDPDIDVAFVWYKEGVTNDSVSQTNNTESQGA